jgi:hypothetical protein
VEHVGVTVLLQDCQFQGLSSSLAGGAVLLRYCEASFLHIDFAWCSAAFGGGAALIDTTIHRFWDVTFEACNSTSRGAALYLNSSLDSGVYLEDITVSESQGPATSVDITVPGGWVSLRNITVSSCDSPALSILGQRVNFTLCTFSENTDELGTLVAGELVIADTDFLHNRGAIRVVFRSTSILMTNVEFKANIGNDTGCVSRLQGRTVVLAGCRWCGNSGAAKI